MQIGLLGAGWVGITTAACLAKFGHQVTVFDLDQARIAGLAKGEVPFFEPGLSELTREGLASGRLRFVAEAGKAITASRVVFSCVNTPSLPDGSADVTAVLASAGNFAAHHADGAVFVVKSTVPPGTCAKVQAEIAGRSTRPFSVAANPEFLAESTALRDTLQPTRLIFGVADPAGRAALREVHEPLIRSGTPVIETGWANAELIKCVANSYLAMRISFINEVANLCEALGADAGEVARGISLDSRIGRVYPGVGYGGGCFPKDIRSLIAEGQRAAAPLTVLEAAHEVNVRQRERLYELMTSALGTVAGKRIAIWGLAFKPKTDDIREAPAVYFIERLLAVGATVTAYDPQVRSTIAKRFPAVTLASSALDAAKDADALVLLTEWAEFSDISLTTIHQTLKGNLLVDGRRIWSRKSAELAGLRYVA